MLLNYNILLEISIFLDRENLEYLKLLDIQLENEYEKYVKRNIVSRFNDSIDLYDSFLGNPNMKIKDLNIDKFETFILKEADRGYEYYETINFNIKDGKYFRNGHIKSFGCYRNDKKNGIFIHYIIVLLSISEDIENLILAQYTFKNDRLEGEIKNYYSITNETNFNLVKDMIIDVNGEVKIFKGQIKKITPFIRGIRQGEKINFSREGKIVKITIYIDDKKEKLIKYSYSDKYPSSIIKYNKNGKIDGDLKYFDSTGKLYRIENYQNGKIISREDI